MNGFKLGDVSDGAVKSKNAEVRGGNTFVGAAELMDDGFKLSDSGDFLFGDPRRCVFASKQIS